MTSQCESVVINLNFIRMRKNLLQTEDEFEVSWLCLKAENNSESKTTTRYGHQSCYLHSRREEDATPSVVPFVVHRQYGWNNTVASYAWRNNSIKNWKTVLSAHTPWHNKERFTFILAAMADRRKLKPLHTCVLFSRCTYLNENEAWTTLGMSIGTQPTTSVTINPE